MERLVWTIAIVFLILWSLGLFSAYTMGSFIHVLVVAAVVVVVVRVIRRDKIIR